MSDQVAQVLMMVVTWLPLPERVRVKIGSYVLAL